MRRGNRIWTSAKSYRSRLTLIGAAIALALLLCASATSATPPKDSLAVLGKPTPQDGKMFYVRIEYGYRLLCEHWIYTRGFIERCIVINRLPKHKAKP